MHLAPGHSHPTCPGLTSFLSTGHSLLAGLSPMSHRGQITKGIFKTEGQAQSPCNPIPMPPPPQLSPAPRDREFSARDVHRLRPSIPSVSAQRPTLSSGPGFHWPPGGYWTLELLTAFHPSPGAFTPGPGAGEPHSVCASCPEGSGDRRTSLLACPLLG